MKGVICGCDEAQEWLLPWWWSRYSDHNDYPVTFCDFGMSSQGRSWCQAHGNLIEIQAPKPANRDAIPLDLLAEWDFLFDNPELFQIRQSWYKKSFACLASPYDQTLWIDLDCEILASLAPLFEYKGFGIVRIYHTSHLPRFHPDAAYNSGVMVFEKGSELMKKWAEASLTLNHRFAADDQLLSYLISELKVEVNEIPEIWNWRMSLGLNIGAKIIHWIKKPGKEYIRKNQGMKPLLDAFQRGLL